ADDEDRVRFLDPGDRRVEGIEIAPRRIEPGTILPAVEIGRTERGEEVLERQHTLRVAEIAGDGADAVRCRGLYALGDSGKRLLPTGRLQLAVAADPGPVETAALQAVEREARLVGQPLFVHVLIQPWQDAQHFGPAG